MQLPRARARFVKELHWQSGGDAHPEAMPMRRFLSSFGITLLFLVLVGDSPLHPVRHHARTFKRYLTNSTGACRVWTRSAVEGEVARSSACAEEPNGRQKIVSSNSVLLSAAPALVSASCLPRISLVRCSCVA